MLKKAKLTFKDYEVTKFVYDKPYGLDLDEEDLDVGLKFNNELGEADEEGLISITSVFFINIQSKKSDFSLIMQIYGHFDIQDNLSEKVQENYLEVSIPAIMYPYIRAMVSTVVVQSGAKPVILPPIDFGYRKKTEHSEEENLLQDE